MSQLSKADVARAAAIAVAFEVVHDQAGHRAQDVAKAIVDALLAARRDKGLVYLRSMWKSGRQNEVIANMGAVGNPVLLVGRTVVQEAIKRAAESLVRSFGRWG